MEMTAHFNPDLGVVILKVKEAITLADVKELVEQAIVIGKENNCMLFLTDAREATLNLSLLDILSVPQLVLTIADVRGKHLSAARRALVVSEITSNIKFFENVTSNSGQFNKAFTDIEEATNWLLAK